HREMSAYIVVLQNPFFALTNEEGEFAIKNVPPGSYTVKAWHEKLKPQSQEVKVTEGSRVRVDFQLRN
ncbi:MAG: carboxypeptidase-like regulatory domain-containing protein, partial [Candidatus Methylomirabilales bacterium]